jgi:hypothetical protein
LFRLWQNIWIILILERLYPLSYRNFSRLRNFIL